LITILLRLACLFRLCDFDTGSVMWADKDIIR
jgi:hypothetical protein